MKLHSCIVTVGVFCLVGAATASGPDALALLRAHLGPDIEIVSKKEIRYCPDNTCDIFRLSTAKRADLLPSFVYLYLFHKSDYIYLAKEVAGSVPFRQSAKNEELHIREQVTGFCKEKIKSPSCILEGMQKQLNISVRFGRYDEGKFIES